MPQHSPQPGKGATSSRAPGVWLAAILVTLVCVLLSGCSGEVNDLTSSRKPVPVTIGPSLDPLNAPIYIAQERGFFTAEGLDVTLKKYPGGADGLNAVVSGAVDFAGCAETPIARAMLAGKRFDVLATLSETSMNNSIIARRDRGISEPEDLRGKRIAVVSGSSADFFLHIYLTALGIDPSATERVRLPVEQLPKALLEGSVDAVSTWAPFSIRLEEALGSGAVVLEQPGLYTTYWQLVAPPQSYRVTPGTRRAVLRALIAAEEYIAENPREAQRIVAEQTGVDVSHLRIHWKTYRWRLRLDQSLLLAIEDEARWMSSSEDTIPDFVPYLDTSPLKSVSPDSVNIVGR